ncbi:MAG: DUF4127 family protein [Candidatus Melainabacteria bacterium]|nr:DUF4127 family protein [Candidatus Melainabacteria bacterium]
MKDFKKVALLPLDNRPVSYLLPKQIADFSGIDLLLPERKYLGDLHQSSNLIYVENWLKSFTDIDFLLISLDNWVYGGLVQSRKHSFELEELKSRVNLLRNHFRELLQQSPTVYGFSSIMRIPNYNSSEEEKDYWKDYGEKVFKWSELMHKVGRGVQEEGISHEHLLENWYQSSKLIPPHVLADYKSHRDKNLTINLLWLELLHEQCFKYLIFSCDDSALYGMNVIEAEYINQEIKKHNFISKAKVISGTDEIPLVLLTKAILEKSEKKPMISIYFNSVEGMSQRARYESNSIHASVLNQIETLGIEMKDFNDSDIVLYIHLADSPQGDHIFHNLPGDTKSNISKLVKLLEGTSKPFILVDLAYANGADPLLIEALLKAKIDWDKCYGYAAWNTCSNSTGSALAIGINRWIAEKKKIFNKEAFKKCLLTKFLDDYAYQTQIRHSKVTEEEINEKIKNHTKQFSKILELDGINVRCALPWKRSFEVEIDVI